MNAAQLWLYWVGHRITGWPVVLLTWRGGQDRVRFVRRRFIYRAFRPTINVYGDIGALLVGGKVRGSIFADEWRALFGSFKPTVIANDGVAVS